MKARFFAIAAMVLGMVSCAKDFAPEANYGGEVDFTLAVSAPELAVTRAGDDTDADGKVDSHNSAYGAIDYLTDADWNGVNLRYILEVYDVADDYTNATPIKDRQVKIVDKYEPVKFELRLAPKRNYHFVVFADFVGGTVTDETPTVDAQKDLGAHHVIGATLGDITIKNDKINDECADAYFGTLDYNPSHNTHNNNLADQKPLILKRPYSKVRVVATDLAELNLNVDPASVQVVYNAPHATAFNAVNGTISSFTSEKLFEGDYNELYKDVKPVGLSNHFYTDGYDAKTDTSKSGVERHTHMTLFTDYILATDEQETIQFTMTVFDKKLEDPTKQPIKTTAFNTQIPVQRNYLTTIIGNVLTTATEIEVSIDDNFANGVEDAPFYVEIWDGKSKNEPKFNAETNTYYVGRASELAWIADYVNAGNTLEGATVEVVGPIDLNCEPWTPIGYGTSFNGTFNGNGWTIANLCYRGKEAGDWCVGLFGCIDGATIKNVSLYNIDIYVDGGCFGALVGVSDNAITIDNVTVEGLVKIEGRVDADDSFYIGTILGTAEGGDGNDDVTISNISINVADGSYIKGGQYVGGVVGRTRGETFMTNIKSNLDVYSKKAFVGGVIGSIQHNSVIENCVANGNVYRLSADGLSANNLKRIGGIAGMWENTTGKVELVDVEFNGALNAPDANGDAMTSFDYAKFVGRGYQTTASKANGVLYINGTKWVDYNTVEVDAHNPFQAALEFDDITISVIDDIETNGNPLEVYGKKVNVDMNGKNVVAGSAVSYAMIFGNGSNVSVQEAGLESNGGGMGVIGGSTLVYNGGDIYVNTESTSGRYHFYVVENSTLVINDGNFSWNTKRNNKRAYIYSEAGSTVYINGGTFGKASTRSGYTAGILGDGNVVIKGGTFGFNPSAWVADGYSAIKSGNTWYVVAGEADSDPVVSTADDLNDAIANAQDGETIYLADGTYAGLFDITGKNVNIVAAGNNAKIDGLVWLYNSNATIKGVKLTNANGVVHPNPTSSKYFNEINDKQPLVGAYLNSNVRFENCTFDIVGPTTYGFYGYAKINPEFVNCTFNCNEIRPIANNGDKITVTGCKFYNQYHYAVRIFENAGERQTVVFTNNTFEGSNAKGEFEGVNISKKGNTATVYADFTISGNTAAKYRYHKNVTLDASCTGADLFVREK